MTYHLKLILKEKTIYRHNKYPHLLPPPPPKGPFRAGHAHTLANTFIMRIPTSTFAAGLSIWRDFKIVAPSFVTVTLRPLPVDCKILSWTYMEHAIESDYQKFPIFIKQRCLQLVKVWFFKKLKTCHSFRPQGCLDQVSNRHCTDKWGLLNVQKQSEGKQIVIQIYLSNYETLKQYHSGTLSLFFGGFIF